MNKLILFFYVSFICIIVADAFISKAYYKKYNPPVVSTVTTSQIVPEDKRIPKRDSNNIQLYNQSPFNDNHDLFDDDDDDDEDENDDSNEFSNSGLDRERLIFLDVEAARKRLEYIVVQNDDDDEMFDVEAARETLEGLVMMMNGDSAAGTAADGSSLKDVLPVDATSASDTTTMAVAEKKKKNDQNPPPSSSKEALYRSRSMSFLRPYLDPLTLEISVLPGCPPLTATEREKRKTEINLLKRLIRSDDNVLDELYGFWFHEKGDRAAAMLEKADTLIGQGPEGWSDAEEILRYLVDDYGVYWTEPINCLATLFYLQGKYEESKVLYTWVLSMKPWHCGALSGIVRVYEAEKNIEMARDWAVNRLPRFSSDGINRRRMVWGLKALIRAFESLFRAEERSYAIFGEWEEEEGFVEEPYFGIHYDDDYGDDNAWQ